MIPNCYSKSHNVFFCVMLILGKEDKTNESKKGC